MVDYWFFQDCMATVELQLIIQVTGPAIRRPEKRHVSSLLREKRQETEYTSACTRILAKGTHNQGKHISECKGNTYHRNWGTDISGCVARVMSSGEQKIRGTRNSSLGFRPFRNEERVWQISYIKVVQQHYVECIQSDYNAYH